MSEDPNDIGTLIGLIVHDLRNPAATLSANFAYLKDSELNVPPEQAEDLKEAISDMQVGLRELVRGLDHLSWIGHWLHGQASLPGQAGDVMTGIERFVVNNRRNIELIVEPSDKPLPARGGGSIGKLLEILAENVERHARGSVVRLRAHPEDERVIVEWIDAGPAIAEELLPLAFTLSGQDQLKSRRDGRYSRFAGLLALRIGVEALGGSLSSDATDEGTRFRIGLLAQTNLD